MLLCNIAKLHLTIGLVDLAYMHECKVFLTGLTFDQITRAYNLYLLKHPTPVKIVTFYNKFRVFFGK